MKTSKISFVIPLVDAQKSRKAGCKAINLSKLIGAHYDVPRGFVISADAHSFHIWASGVRNVAASIESPESTRSAILNTEIPNDIWASIADAYHRLSLQLGIASPNLLVRSSAVEQNSHTPSLSCLNVSGEDALKAAIKEIWASAWIEADNTEPAVAIIVQQMLGSAARGKVFTADPANGDPLSVVVLCDRPEGHARFKVDLRDFRVVEREANAPIDESSVLRLAEQAILAESVISSPVEIEWLYEGGRFWALQADAMSVNVKPAEEQSVKLIPMSRQPVSFMARTLFWSNQREDANVQLKNGHVYSACAKDVPEGAKGWQPAAERLLEKWRKEAWPELSAKAAAIIGKDLTRKDYAHVVELLAEAGDISLMAAQWMDQMRCPSAQFNKMLRKMLNGIENGAALYDRLIGGLPCPTFMRDARLQEFGDRFSTAEQTGKLADELWWKSYRTEVKSFASEYGYSFKDSGEMWDPASWKSWIEDLDVVFRMIGAIARRGNRPSLVTLHCKAEESAAQASFESLRMAAEDKTKFRKMVQAARGWLCARNECEQTFVLSCTAMRLAALEMGRRLCKNGLIAQREDVFHLTIDEIKAISQTKSDDERSAMVAKIAMRKHEYWLESRMAAADSKSAISSPKDGLMKGFGAGPGVISGRAKIVRSIEEAGDIEAGDILVIDVPWLAWTPFLGVAAGLVTGGSCLECMSYQAFMKDYNIPAVTGCEGVMGIVTDGQRIIVNGFDGTVDLCRS
ncbi:MAG: hypothetical protein NT018_07165 [Armatimonadetes bacterium]|nr:hypothetical protein [Armatimonadota bacterium]